MSVKPELRYNMNISLHPNRIEKYVSAREFLEISKHPERIISSKLILPRLGTGEFGKFKVVLKSDRHVR